MEEERKSGAEEGRREGERVRVRERESKSSGWKKEVHRAILAHVQAATQVVGGLGFPDSDFLTRDFLTRISILHPALRPSAAVPGRRSLRGPKPAPSRVHPDLL